MSFLNQLKSQAQELQSKRSDEDRQFEEHAARTEQACRQIASYFDDLARQLSVIQPPGPALTLDGKAKWPPMKLVDFRSDARRKRLRDQEVFDYIGMGWRIVPRTGEPVPAAVAVNFPIEMKRVEERLMMGPVKHDRREIRDPEKKNALREVRYEFLTQTRGSVSATPDHERGHVHFRLLNTAGFEVVQTIWPATRINQELLDELAKRLVGQPSTFA
ncbi:hypothetical protein [Ramlibacter alkalitolerans]|uniref:Uncharacterized protein n=1 Tax=Ramlibacter alkalitolerans TaxID=2039631 RepID=A0ABS1JI76_9BURK|nr:hypothetical protein [Ramlibacter alkalitolerans]MBL0423923.1 hypothetical protein [Ramlibacter alkalitolerans]